MLVLSLLGVGLMSGTALAASPNQIAKDICIDTDPNAQAPGAAGDVAAQAAGDDLFAQGGRGPRL